MSIISSIPLELSKGCHVSDNIQHFYKFGDQNLICESSMSNEDTCMISVIIGTINLVFEEW